MNNSYPIKCYKIWWEEKPEIGEYVGSTKQKLSVRMVNHRQSAKKNQSGKIYDAMRSYGGAFKYVLLGEYPVENYEQQRMYEQKWMDELKPALNMIRSYKTVEDHKQEQQRSYLKYRDKRIEDARVYRRKNATYLNEQRRIKYNTLLKNNPEYVVKEKQRQKDNASKYKSNNRQRHQLAREEGTYRCESCNYNAGRIPELQTHLLSLKHQRNTTT